VVDPLLGRVVAGGSVVRWGAEGWGTTHYIANGEIATPHSGGPGVLVLGDSHTEAFQVDDERKFVSVAERWLWQRGRRVDLRNFGRSGGSMADYVWLTRQLRENLRPVAFVIQLEDGDFGPLAFDASRPNHFVMRPDGQLELAHASAPAEPPARTPTLKMLAYAEERFQSDRKPASAAAVLSARASVPLQVQLLREAAANVPVILLRLPYSPYAPTGSDAASGDFATLCRLLAWPCIDPAAEFLASRRRGHDPRTFLNERPLEAHLNRDGHAIVVQLLADEIERVLR